MKQYLIVVVIILFHFKGFTQPEKEYDTCQCYKKEIDKFNGEISFYPTSLDCPIRISKFIEKGSTSYYISIEFQDNYLTVRGKGLQLLLANKKIISLPNAELTCKVEEYNTTNGKYNYSSFEKITVAQLKQIVDSEVTDLKLDIFEKDLPDDCYKVLRNLIQCLLIAK